MPGTMRSDKVTSLLFNQPLPVSSISLGRLVRDPLYPDVDYYEPTPGTRPGPDAVSTGLDATTATANHQQEHEQKQQQQQQELFIPNVVDHQFENFENTLEAARGTRLELSLLNILSLVPAARHRASSTTLRSRLCVVRQLRNPDAFFRAACRERGTRAWLESEAIRPDSRGRVYMVCGFKILTDASVSHTESHSGGVSVSTDLPVAAIASAAGGVPLPLPGSVSATLHTGASSGEMLAYTAPGERVYAVLYRRIRFALFATRSVDNAYLEKGLRWKSLIGSRSEGDEDEEDGIEVEVAGAPEADELDGKFAQAEIGGEQILYADESQAQE